MSEPRQSDWHAIENEQLLHRLGGSPHGLNTTEAQERLQTYGPNQLRPPQVRSIWARFFSQFHNLLIYVLIGAGLVTLLLGHGVDSAVIVAVVLVNAIIGFIQEGKAERALDAVRKLLSPNAMVMRDGQRLTLPAAEVVPGDLVFVQSGDRVPADVRLLLQHELWSDESMLTGESLPVRKQNGAVELQSPLGDRCNMLYAGTMITAGQGQGLVVSTGEQTEIGRIGSLLEEVQTLSTPLTRQMHRFAVVLTVVILAIAALTALFGIAVQGYTLEEMFLAAVGLAVAAIPEGLPAIITIALAIGVQRMAGKHAIIRRLPAVETLGSVTTICSDKTGTLTRNEMTVQGVILAERELGVGGSGYDPHGGFFEAGSLQEVEPDKVLQELCRGVILCNDSALRQSEGQWRVEGDPMEGALSVLGIKAGLSAHETAETYPRLDVIPFESEHRFMATLHHDHAGHHFLYVKGAAEALFPRCAAQRGPTGSQPFDEGFWNGCIEKVASKGQRTLVIAAREMPAGTQELNFDDIDDLTLLGVVGITDPPRQEAIKAVAECASAGIRVKMITGDHAGTALAIGRQLGIVDGSGVVTGSELEAMDDAALRKTVQKVDVFARATPEHKLRLVQALQENDEIVAMTGDGVNDAPALKRADVGVAMGMKGTEAAKQAAEMVLADDNFASIMRAVREGRTVYDNIRKSILFILPTNGGEALTILAAIALGRMLPVTAAQILWVNMITAVTLALALAFEPAEKHIMRRPPRDADEPLLNRFMVWRILFVSILMVIGTFGLFLYERASGASIELARTVAVNTLVMAEVFYLLNVRLLHASVLTRNGIFGNRYVLMAIPLVLLFQMLFTYLPPMQKVFSTTGLDWQAWARIVAFGLLLFVLVELEKWIINLNRSRNAVKA